MPSGSAVAPRTECPNFAVRHEVRQNRLDHLQMFGSNIEHLISGISDGNVLQKSFGFGNELNGGFIHIGGNGGTVNVRCTVSGVMKRQPVFNAVDQSVFGGAAKQFDSRNPEDNVGTDILFDPAFHCFPAKFVGNFKILNDPGAERLLLQRRKCRSIAEIVLDRFVQNRNRPSQGCKVKCHKNFVCGCTFSRINWVIASFNFSSENFLSPRLVLMPNSSSGISNKISLLSSSMIWK